MTQKILLADDSVTIQKVIELTFMDEDYEVTTAGDGGQALERLDEMSPDVVIADVHMPVASGFDVAKRAKQLHPGTPVLLLVGTFEPFDEDDYAASGADSYLKKPFDSQELLQRVDELLASAPAGDTTGDTAGAAEAARSSDVPSPAAETASYQQPGLDDSEATPADDVPPPFADEALGGWAAAGEPSSDAESGPDHDADDPFPDLGAPSGSSSAHDDIFSSLDEADGSSQVLPPPELDRPAEQEVAPMAEADLEAEEPAWEATPDATAPADESPEMSLEVSPDISPEFSEAPRIGAPLSDVEDSEPPAEASSRTVAVDTSQWRNGSAASGLSDEDVDRIAQRVVELLGGDVVREVAWEVVPDLAEVVIKDRLRELESQVD